MRWWRLLFDVSPLVIDLSFCVPCVLAPRLKYKLLFAIYWLLEMLGLLSGEKAVFRAWFTCALLVGAPTIYTGLFRLLILFPDVPRALEPDVLSTLVVRPLVLIGETIGYWCCDKCF